MSMTGIFMNLVKIGKGAINGDANEVITGVVGTATSTAGVVIRHTIHEEIGNRLSEKGEEIANEPSQN